MRGSVLNSGCVGTQSVSPVAATSCPRFGWKLAGCASQDAPVRPGRSYVVAALGIPKRRRVGTFGQNLWFGKSKLVGS